MFPFNDDFSSENNTAKLAWLLFMQSGAPGYYMMFSDLTNQVDLENREDERLR